MFSLIEQLGTQENDPRPNRRHMPFRNRLHAFVCAVFVLKIQEPKMKNPITAKLRAQQLIERLLLIHYAETEDARAYHEAQAARAWKELKEVME